MWWLWVVGGLVAWTVVGFGIALVIGRSIRTADLRSVPAGSDPVLSPAAAAAARPAPAPVVARVRRRAVPLPAFGIALVVLAVALETSGYVVALSGSTGPSAQLLSMDAPLSLPRMFVALIFVAINLVVDILYTIVDPRLRATIRRPV